MAQIPVIRKGDKTSHGGTVLEGLNDVPVLGIPIACKGHMVSCPKCKGTYPIIDGIEYAPVKGKFPALEGMKTACGASLISSQSVYTYEWISGSFLTQGMQSANKENEVQDYGAKFKVIDSETGEVMKNTTYFASVNGVNYEGKTDGDGYAEVHSSKENDEIEFHVSFQTPNKLLDKDGK